MCGSVKSSGSVFFFIKIPSTKPCLTARMFSLFLPLILVLSAMGDNPNIVNFLPSFRTHIFDGLDTMVQLKPDISANKIMGRWNLSLVVNPFALACNPQYYQQGEQMFEEINAHAQANVKMKKVWACTDDGQHCDYVLVEDDEYVEEEDYNSNGINNNGSQNRNNSNSNQQTTMKKWCESVNETFQRNMSGQLVVCFLAPRVKAQFRGLFSVPEKMTNVENNEVAKFCNEKISNERPAERHGLRIRFWVIRDRNARDFLATNMLIDFSFSNASLTLEPVLRKIVENSNLSNVESSEHINITFDFCGPEISVNGKTILQMEELYKKFQIEFANGIHAIQPLTADPRLIALVHMDFGARQNGISFFLSQKECSKFYLLLNGRKLSECKKEEDKERKSKQDQEEADRIIEEVEYLYRNCHGRIDPEQPPVPKAPPEAIDGPKHPLEKLKYRLKEAKSMLEEAQKKCGPANTRMKRQIGRQIFIQYSDPDNFQGSSRYWDPQNFPIPFTVEQNRSPDWIKGIQKGVLMIMRQTCINFKFVEATDAFEESYIYFTETAASAPDDCYTQLGRSDEGNQNEIVFGSKCRPGTAAHEVMHVLGFHHEHKRTDQMEYIWIPKAFSWDSQLVVDSTTKNFGMPYDFGSVMHYPPVEGEDYFMIAKMRSYQQTMGQRLAISYKDAKLLNRLYCSKVCKDNLECQNGGYTDPKDCSKCCCPAGFVGPLCDLFNTGEKKCHSGRYRADSMPNYIETSDVMDGTRDCFWSIKTLQVTQKIVIVVKKLENFDCTHPCPDDNFLEIQTQKDKTARGARLCCYSQLPYTYTLEPGVDAVIRLKRTSNNKKFQLTYETHKIGIDDARINYETSGVCMCPQVFNPWYEPTPNASITDELPRGFFNIETKTRFDLVINGRYRFYSQNGTKIFYRRCVLDKKLGGEAFGIWYKDDAIRIRLDHVVAESCQSDYEGSGCREVNKKWKQFVACLWKIGTDIIGKADEVTACEKEHDDYFVLRMCVGGNANLPDGISDGTPV